MRIHSFTKYEQQYKKSVEHPEEFWGNIAEHFHWQKKWDKVLEWDFHKPDTKWFVNGKMNITYNCLDVHALKNPHKIAYTWEPNEPGAPNCVITYGDLLKRVCRM